MIKLLLESVKIVVMISIDCHSNKFLIDVFILNISNFLGICLKHNDYNFHKITVNKIFYRQNFS
ncbi:hypothetical protein WN50_33330 [Limnoraphis robusta CS-951]|uniref:Uncharacterized protein n=1 Tax=Limnoraphis robusta CS-951 TaxID=1637645 RepID=A0A0J9EX41_9CYAN|nr:hypothetical protein WN50_33330 [Limnoraphis robusta CS-951]